MADGVVPALAAAHVLLCVSCASAFAQAWPAKPVRVIAPFAPASTADTLGRVVSASSPRKGMGDAALALMGRVGGRKRPRSSPSCPAKV